MTEFNAAFEAQLEAAHVGQAIALAKQRLSQHPGDAQAQFALGAAQFLDALQNLTQSFYRQGLSSPGADGQDSPIGEYVGVRMLPFLRLPVPPNPAPEPFSAAVLRQDFERFSADLAKAGTTLAAVPQGDVSLQLDMGTLAIDMNGDGKAGPGENLQLVLAEVAYIRPHRPLPVFNFDAADAVWLHGYTELLLGMTHMILAYDWHETVDQTFANAFPAADLAASPLAKEAQKAARVLKETRFDSSDYDACTPANFYGSRSTEELTARTYREPAWRAAHADLVARYEQCNKAQNSLRAGEIADLVAFVHLWHWPVIEPGKLHSARLHFLNMIALSRQDWKLILAETDDDREWVPSPTQTSQFARMRVNQTVVTGWMSFLDQAQGVLEGRYLIPHWRFTGDRGLNVKKMFEEPRTLDPLMLIAGQDALPYIEKGTLAPGSTAQTGMRILGGGLLSYFLWFN